MRCKHWAQAFATERKDHRYYELVEDTIQPEFDFRYFAIRDESGEMRAVQPFFLLDQDILAGTSRWMKISADFIRRLWPRFMRCVPSWWDVPRARDIWTATANCRALARPTLGCRDNQPCTRAKGPAHRPQGISGGGSCGAGVLFRAWLYLRAEPSDDPCEHSNTLASMTI